MVITPELTSLFSSSLFGMLFLVVGFGALVYTFVWFARLWWRQLEKSEERQVTQPAVPEGPLVEDEVEAIESGRASIGHGANYGLVLAILSCLLFKFSPIMLLLSAAGLFYSGRALGEGIWRFRLVLIRAVIGVALSVASVGLLFLEMTGQLRSLGELF